MALGWRAAARARGVTMSDIVGESRARRFCPELRGWAALRFVDAVPRELRVEVELLGRSAGGVSAGVAGGDFRRIALSAVSSPAAIAWSREMAAAAPVLGPATGPACLARLLACSLMGVGGGLAATWPSIVGEVWAAIRPALERVGIETRGPMAAEVRHEVAAPLALVFLKSLAAGRKDLRLLGQGDPGRPDGPPLGWAPGIDALRPLLAYLLMGQVPGRFQSHAFLSSPFARQARAAGLAVQVAVRRYACPLCGVARDGPRGESGGSSGTCRQCGSPLVAVRTRQLVARSVLERTASDPAGEGEDRRIGRPAGGRGGDCGAAAACDAAEVSEARRACLERAGRLWDAVLMGGGHGVASMVVLGALAGVRPLSAIGGRPAARREWLENLVERLADGRVDREPLADEANAAREGVASGLGLGPPPRILSAYVGVLATRFRHVVLGRGAERGAERGCV